MPFQTVASGGYVPSSAGLKVSSSLLPSGAVFGSPVPIQVSFTTLGNFGTGNPVTKLQVQRRPGGTWMDVSGATVTDNGTIRAVCFGVAVRVSIPTLTAPGTVATAPRVLLVAEPLTRPNQSSPMLMVASHTAALASGTTGTLPTAAGVAGHGSMDPSRLGGPIDLAHSLVFLTVEGAGSATIQGLYRDGASSPALGSGSGAWITESASISTAAQVAIESHAEAFRMNFTDSTGTTDLYLDIFRVEATC